MLIAIMKHPHSGIIWAWTQLHRAQVMRWVGLQKSVCGIWGARFSSEKHLGCEWSHLQFELGIVVGDVATTENIKINQKISG